MQSNYPQRCGTAASPELGILCSWRDVPLHLSAVHRWQGWQAYTRTSAAGLWKHQPGSSQMAILRAQ